MSTIDPTKEFFCPAPWKNLFQHGNSASPCHSSRNNLGLGPAEYMKSDFLKSVKEDFLAGRVPVSCLLCKTREDLGIKSTRQSVVFRDGTQSPIYNRKDFEENKDTRITRLELRTTNLCNYKCRMCDANSSSEIAREQGLDHKIFHASPEIIEELKSLTLDQVDLLCLTGGEPMLIKEYSTFLQHLIDKGYTEKSVELFTNCSVYNPNFIDKLSKFKKVKFVMSIDGVGKVAEYQRKGTVWDTVEKNIYRFTKMDKPFELYFNTAISSYVLLDVSSLATFLMKLYSMNNEIGTRCYSTIKPDFLNFINMDSKSRAVAVEQIDKALEILTVDNFYIFKKELTNIKNVLVNSVPVNPKLFIDHTHRLDKIRNEKFENVFGYNLPV